MAGAARSRPVFAAIGSWHGSRKDLGERDAKGSPTNHSRRTDMKTLTIKDLAATCELDHKAMATVRGGYKMQTRSYSLYPMPETYSPSYTSSIDATQNLQQFQNVVNATANGSAFVDGVYANNNTSQFGQNNIYAAH
jgi:hypothetical protein